MSDETGTRRAGAPREAGPLVLTGADYAALIEASPNAYLVLAPDLTMVAANLPYLTGVARSSGELVGRDVFDVFPNSPLQPDVDQVGQVRASMQRAVRTGQRDVLLAHRYDIPGADGVTFEVRYWNITNTPLTDDRGGTTLLLHHTADITELVQERERRRSVAAQNQALRARVDRADADLLLRARELTRLNERLREVGEHHRTVAVALQDALLTRLPESDHLQLVARYLTAADQDKVGGDWYDAVIDEGGTTHLVIGDVVGHDITAAAKMGQVRNLLRALLVDRPDDSPAQLLQRLDAAMRRLRTDALTTVLLATVERGDADSPAGTHRLRWSNAGHPAPLLVHPDGRTDLLDGARSLLLGIDPSTERSDLTRTVPSGATLLLYTDGLIERRGEDLAEGKARLTGSALEHRALPTDQLLDAVLADVLHGPPADDVAVLAVRFDDRRTPVPQQAGRRCEALPARGGAASAVVGAASCL